MKRSYTLVALVVILLGGCGIPPSMHVREGGQPRYQDEDVLFRATYYFRVFDFCEGNLDGDHAAQRIKNDSLYRFRMTGKGKSSFSRVRFESGSLQAWQIDPLGASVEFDKDGKPYFVSQQKREEQLRQSRLYDEVHRLHKLLSELKCSPKPGAAAAPAEDQEQCRIIRRKIEDNLRLIGPGGTPNIVSVARNLADDAVRSLAESLRDASTPVAPQVTVRQVQSDLSDALKAIREAPNKLYLLVALDKAKQVIEGMKSDATLKAVIATAPGQPESDAEDKRVVAQSLEQLQLAVKALEGAPEAPTSATTMSDKALACGDGLPARRGFQILGPEGWRTFDQDERLVLAMSASGKPLLDALRDLSNRALSTKSTGFSQEQLLRETLAASRARVALGQLESASANALPEALDALVSSFEKEGN